MGKHLTNKEFEYGFKRYASEGTQIFHEFANTTQRQCIFTNTSVSGKRMRNIFRNRYRKGVKNGYNISMTRKNTSKKRGRPPKKQIETFEDLLPTLTREQLEEIATRYHEIQKEEKVNNKKEEAKKLSSFTFVQKSILFAMHRTSFYKINKKRTYKFDHLKEMATNIFDDSRQIYGRRRLKVMLNKAGVDICERTLGRSMKRGGLHTAIRVAKKKREFKNTKVKHCDLVKREYNPLCDNIIATDVTYIKANSIENHVYLSIAISHYSKAIESGSISESNDSELVWETLSFLAPRNNMIVHSDHGHQYSSHMMLKLANNRKYEISMSRVGNSLDNREAEYFFSIIKSECLNRINTSKMNINQIETIVSEYISGYNTKRINGSLNGKAPAYASAYVN